MDWNGLVPVLSWIRHYRSSWKAWARELRKTEKNTCWEWRLPRRRGSVGKSLMGSQPGHRVTGGRWGEWGGELFSSTFTFSAWPWHNLYLFLCQEGHQGSPGHCWAVGLQLKGLACPCPWIVTPQSFSSSSPGWVSKLTRGPLLKLLILKEFESKSLPGRCA